MIRLEKIQHLRNLPEAERSRLLQVAAEKAADWYANDKELTAFETFGENDFLSERQLRELTRME